MKYRRFQCAKIINYLNEISDIISMKKKNIYSKKQIFNVPAIFLGVFVIVILIAIYLSFFPSIALSPDDIDEGAMPFAEASSLLAKLGPDGIDWYCGKRESFTDAQGNNYAQKELEELKRILGNEKRLMQEFC